jgi:hypothetical protein
LGHNSVNLFPLLNDESFELLNRIEEPDTKIEKNWQKSKSTFWAFLGSAVLAGAVALFFFF